MESSKNVGPLKRWLREARAGAQTAGVLRVVLGNEAADLDSMTSSVALARLLARGDGSGRAASLPVINIPRADFVLRPEAVRLFAQVGVDPLGLVFLDEIDLGAACSSGRLRLVLVDHNRLSSAQAGWAPAVEEIVDHHSDGGLYPGAKRTIAPVGSCATLVTERFLETAPRALDPATGRLLLGTILLDTVNLDPAAKRVTPRDEAAAGRLLGLTGADREGLYRRLQAERSTVSALSSRDILRRDYKEYAAGGLRYGISSAPLPLGRWVGQDPDLERSLRAWAGERGLGLLLVMSVCTEPELRRELAVHTEDRALRDDVVAFLNRSGLGLAPLAAGPATDGATLCFSQADGAGSRKKVQPLLDGFLEKRRQAGRAGSAGT